MKKNMPKEQSETHTEWFAIVMAGFCMCAGMLNIACFISLRGDAIQVYHTNEVLVTNVVTVHDVAIIFRTNEVFIGIEVWHTNEVTNYHEFPYHEYLDHMPMTPTQPYYQQITTNIINLGVKGSLWIGTTNGIEITHSFAD